MSLEKLIDQAAHDHASTLERALERALLTGTAGVADIAVFETTETADNRIEIVTYRTVVTNRVTYGQIYEFPSEDSWHRYLAAALPEGEAS